MVVRKPKKAAAIDVKVVINGTVYSLNELSFESTIPSVFFKKADPVNELLNWLGANAQDAWYVAFDKGVVKFKSEDDAILLKLTFG